MPEYLKREEMTQNAEAVFCSGLKPVNYLPNITPETNDAIKQNVFLDRLPPQPGTPADMSFEEFTVSTCYSKDLALIFNAAYERSGDGVEGLTKRMEYAERWKDYFEEY